MTHLNKLGVMDDLWNRLNGQSRQILGAPVWPGAAISSAAPNILAMFKAIQQETSTLLGEAPVMARMVQYLGLTLETHSDKQVWILAHPQCDQGRQLQ